MLHLLQQAQFQKLVNIYYMICPFKYSNYTPKYNKVVAMLGPPIRVLPKKTTVVLTTLIRLLAAAFLSRLGSGTVALPLLSFLLFGAAQKTAAGPRVRVEDMKGQSYGLHSTVLLCWYRIRRSSLSYLLRALRKSLAFSELHQREVNVVAVLFNLSLGLS